MLICCNTDEHLLCEVYSPRLSFQLSSARIPDKIADDEQISHTAEYLHSLHWHWVLIFVSCKACNGGKYSEKGTACYQS